MQIVVWPALLALLSLHNDVITVSTRSAAGDALIHQLEFISPKLSLPSGCLCILEELARASAALRYIQAVLTQAFLSVILGPLCHREALLRLSEHGQPSSPAGGPVVRG